MEEDITSRKLLRKKFLDRWENEGGRICDDLKKKAESHSPRAQGSDIPNPPPEISAARNDNLPVVESQRNDK